MNHGEKKQVTGKGVNAHGEAHYAQGESVAFGGEFGNRPGLPLIHEIQSQPPRRQSLEEALDALQLLTVTDVCKLLRISKPTLWRIRRAGNFPDPTRVTERIFGWRRSEIDAWLATRPSQRRY
jgi:prophage regulatory protein